jgi:hypothetical protein
VVKYKVGDLVRIKTWEQMVSEFGGDDECIPCKCSFTDEMKYLCGTVQEIRHISPWDFYRLKDEPMWSISDDMIEGLAVVDILTHERTPVSEEHKTIYDVHKELCLGLNDLYVRKNHDYGNTFGEGFKEYGLIMAVIRLEDKFKRFKQLALHPDDQCVKDESIEDTLRDLANYALMTIVEMKGQV